jgi:hypothetical protein
LKPIEGFRCFANEIIPANYFRDEKYFPLAHIGLIYLFIYHLIYHQLTPLAPVQGKNIIFGKILLHVIQ